MNSTTERLVHASATRNWCKQDPILDWLDLYGTAKGFAKDEIDVRTDMGTFLREKGRLFEAAVMRCIEEKLQVVRIVPPGEDREDPVFYVQTLRAMDEGVEAIYQPVVQDPERGTWGLPDLLVRSDLLHRISEHPRLSDEEAKLPSIPMEGVGGGLDIPMEGAGGGLLDAKRPFHYRVLDIKFTNLDLTAKQTVGNDDSDRVKKAQLLIYNRALGQMQGYEPPVAYLLGRGFKFTRKGVDYRGDGCFEHLGACDMADPELARLVDDAVAWARRVRSEGARWEALPQPTVPELHPNMSNQQDSPWHGAKKRIAEETGELTLLWRVTPKNRPLAHQAGVVRFRDERCEAPLFQLSATFEDTLRQIIEINREHCPDLIRPAKITANEADWRIPRPLEFYVDFETVSDLDDDFSTIPKKNGQPLIYMIGCGHTEPDSPPLRGAGGCPISEQPESGHWSFKVFTCDHLTAQCEREIIDAWHAHMTEVQRRLWPEGEPLVFHWSHAENSTLNTAYNSARNRHGVDWPALNWYDLLNQVARKEPMTVKGALAFGLKAIAKAMHSHGLIQTNWTNGPTDGLGAMVGAWTCDREANAKNCSMCDLPLMKEIEDYNEVDCKVMWEILSYLRGHH